ncbi:uncharacterized protein LOC114402024 [Glycine soja]|uniref:uncharacterized protein LOC114402024 n=1 Tax=Glycine soja TaxID=3848 RepID=UPI001040BB4A|nr:uncharacterized protein LOC114402024 [Glycine soja]
MHVDDAVQMLVELLMVTTEVAKAETGQCHGPYVRMQWVGDIYEYRYQAGHWTTTAHAFLLHLLDWEVRLGSSCAGHMYDHLNDASISTSRQLGGYITLLQCWIYKHFPLVAESTADPNYGEDSPRAYKWIATKKTVKSILCNDYRDWFFHISHPFMTPGQPSDPQADGHATQPRVAPQDPDTDVHPVTEPAALSTSVSTSAIDVDEPRHAVEACYAIVERLECHFNLGVITPGTLTHEVIEECLRIARSVTQDQLVYVRSRRRRRTDQS